MSSSLSPRLVARRRQQLYGPARCAGYQTIQDLQREDHVQQSFRRGVLPVPSKETYDTITARDYKVCAVTLAWLYQCMIDFFFPLKFCYKACSLRRGLTEYPIIIFTCTWKAQVQHQYTHCLITLINRVTSLCQRLASLRGCPTHSTKHT